MGHYAITVFVGVGICNLGTYLRILDGKHATGKNSLNVTEAISSQPQSVIAFEARRLCSSPKLGKFLLLNFFFEISLELVFLLQ